MKNFEWSLEDKTRLEIESIVSRSKLFLKGDYSNSKISVYTSSFLKRLYDEYEKLQYDKTEERFQIALENLTSDFIDDKFTIENVETIVERYFCNRMTLNNETVNPLFKFLRSRLKSKGEKVRGVNNGGIIRVREVTEDEKVQGEKSYKLEAYNLTDLLVKLFNELKKAGFISHKTKDTDFFNAFTGKIINKNKPKIQWEKEITSCTYFICQLLKIEILGYSNNSKEPKTNRVPYEIIDHPFNSNERNPWKKLSELFQDSKGAPIANGRSHKDKFKRYLPSSFREIDNILSNLSD